MSDKKYKQLFALTTLLQVSRLVKDLREEEMERRFRTLNRILEQAGSEQDFCEMVFGTEKELGDGTGRALIFVLFYSSNMSPVCICFRFSGIYRLMISKAASPVQCPV